jgi:hypothetical protein
MNREKNCWKGFVIGMGGSLAGLMAMDAYWKAVAPKVQEKVDLGGQDAYPDSINLDDISVVKRQYKGEESATDALGRLLYQAIMSKEPESEETKKVLSYLVHWAYGILQGGLYGAWRANNGGSPGVKSGAAFATGLWLLGDEMAVPMLGLQSGPTAVAPEDHINRLGAHLTYGLATAVTSRLLHKIL